MIVIIRVGARPGLKRSEAALSAGIPSEEQHVTISGSGFTSQRQQLNTAAGNYSL